MSLGMYESLWLFGFFHLFHTLRAESPLIFLDKSEGDSARRVPISQSETGNILRYLKIT